MNTCLFPAFTCHYRSRDSTDNPNQIPEPVHRRIMGQINKNPYQGCHTDHQISPHQQNIAIAYEATSLRALNHLIDDCHTLQRSNLFLFHSFIYLRSLYYKPYW